ncbi:MAG: prepilin-type N-terminal cleavage/methylation domain-containing protein [Candidatus Anammoxibacter sp.]
MKKEFKGNLKGFTLIELIVVLLIIGIILAVSIPKAFRGLESVKSRRLLSDIVMFLRETRMDALTKGETVKVLVKLEEGVFEVDNGKTFTIPEEAGISINVEDEYLYIEVEETGFAFYPNGMASGAKLILSNNGNDMAVIYLDPFTGLANYSMDFEL